MYSYESDRIWGAVIAVYSGIAACCTLAFTFFLAIILHSFNYQVENAADVHPPLGILGIAIKIVGLLVVGFYVLGIVGGIGIAASKKWGFDIVLVLSIMRGILQLAQLPHGLVFLVLDAACAYYCYQRLTGNVGPRPI